VIITQVELDSPLLLMPDNQTCTLPAKPGFINNCRTDLIPGQKVQCYYSLGSNTCEPRHQYTSGTNQSCFGSNASPNAPQWFDLYNTQNKTVQIQLFQLIILQGGKSWGNEGLFPTPINLGPHEKCTFGLGPSDEPLSLDQTNMGFAASYTFEGKNYTASTPPLTDLYNDTRTWQYDGNKWTFAEHNTITIPEFPFAVPILLISTISAIVFYRMKLGK
jgi:predicted secreted protein with PEFG-CTERM motif